MRVEFEIDVLGEELTVSARADDVNEYSEALNLRIKILKSDGSLVDLYKYVDDIEDIERITQAALDELYSNKYEGGLHLE